MKLAYKTVTYTFVHMVVAFVIAWAVSGSLAVAMGISMIEPFFQVAAYAVHERIWTKIGHKTSDYHEEKKVSCIAPCCAPSFVSKLKSLRSKKDAA